MCGVALFDLVFAFAFQISFEFVFDADLVSDVGVDVEFNLQIMFASLYIQRAQMWNSIRHIQAQ